MVYKKATAELIRFDNSDVITTSNAIFGDENDGFDKEDISGICPGKSPNKKHHSCPAQSNHARD